MGERSDFSLIQFALAKVVSLVYIDLHIDMLNLYQKIEQINEKLIIVNYLRT